MSRSTRLIELTGFPERAAPGQAGRFNTWMAIAGEWYSSEPFWAGVGALATLAVGGLTAWVAYTIGFPRRRLLYYVRTETPLLTAPDGVRDDLELKHRGRLLERPYVIELVIVGRGRRDIPRDAFDNGEPIRLDLGVPIVELLQSTTSDSDSSRPVPQVRVDGTALAVGPVLIGRRQELVLSALVEGKPSLRCEAALTDVRVQQRLPPNPIVFDVRYRTFAISLVIFLVVQMVDVVYRLLSGTDR
jgi:hypothetical protein